jgi:hypothetical protein
MKAVVRNAYGYSTTVYVNHTYSNGSVVTYKKGLEIKLLTVVLQQMNMTFFHVPTPEGLELEHVLFPNLVRSMIVKNASIALGDLGKNFELSSVFDFTNTYKFISVRWYVPCSIKYPRWSSIFRILSVDLWVILIMAIVLAAISTTLVGRYSFTSEWQKYKSLTISLNNVWAAFLGMPVSTMPRTPSLRSLFLAWVYFSLAFSTVFQAFLTTFLTDSGYKTPIQNKDELFASGIKLAYPQDYEYIFKYGDEKETLNVRSNRVICPSRVICLNWALHQKNVSVLLSDTFAQLQYAVSDFTGENSESLLCKLEDGEVYNNGVSMIMIHGDPLLRRVNEIIDRVLEAGIYNYWTSIFLNELKLLSRKIAIFHPLEAYYSFNMYHMQPAFYVLLMGWFVSSICFMAEIFFNRGLSKRT